MRTSVSIISVITIISAFAVSGNVLHAQGAPSTALPVVKVKTPDGKVVSTSTFRNDGKPIIVNFWATWCSPCKQELNAIATMYEEWQIETGVKLIAISIDDARNSPKVAPFIKGRNWPFEVYIDENSDFKRALNVNEIPHTFILNGKGEIVSQHKSYAPGDELSVFEEIKKIVAEDASKTSQPDEKK
ncbi:MAG: TlpA family protein disulfide reductase, partial [Candidatus Kapaibacterium sp.]